MKWMDVVVDFFFFVNLDERVLNIFESPKYISMRQL